MFLRLRVFEALEVRLRRKIWVHFVMTIEMRVEVAVGGAKVEPSEKIEGNEQHSGVRSGKEVIDAMGTYGETRN